jgi:hypothetical protein
MIALQLAQVAHVARPLRAVDDVAVLADAVVAVHDERPVHGLEDLDELRVGLGQVDEHVVPDEGARRPDLLLDDRDTKWTFPRPGRPVNDLTMYWPPRRCRRASQLRQVERERGARGRLM